MDLLVPLAVGVLLGLVMGLLGGGGGVLAVPLLLALGLSLDAAATTSLVVVALGALAGLVPHARAGRVDWGIGLVFGLLGAVGAVVGSRAAFLVDDRLQLGLFTLLLLAAGVSMLRGRAAADDKGGDGEDGVDRPLADPNWARVAGFATLVGLATGFFGVGGGFIAVPALVLALRVPMRRAGPTALVVILVNATVAFVAHGTSHLDVRITVLVGIGCAVAAVVGALLQPRVPALALQRAFGVLLVVVAVYEAVRLVVG